MRLLRLSQSFRTSLEQTATFRLPGDVVYTVFSGLGSTGRNPTFIRGELLLEREAEMDCWREREKVSWRNKENNCCREGEEDCWKERRGAVGRRERMTAGGKGRRPV